MCLVFSQNLKYAARSERKNIVTFIKLNYERKFETGRYFFGNQPEFLGKKNMLQKVSRRKIIVQQND